MTELEEATDLRLTAAQFNFPLKGHESRLCGRPGSAGELARKPA